jgi:hypothetical protein
MSGVGVDPGQTGFVCAGVLREEGDVGEGGVLGAETLGDVVGRRGVAAAVAVKCVCVVINLQAFGSAERVD